MLGIGYFIFYNVSTELEEMIENNDSKIIDDEIGYTFTFLPIILISIAAISMLVIFRFGSSTPTYVNVDEIDIKKEKPSKKSNIPEKFGDYSFTSIETVEDALEIAREYRDNGYRVKIKNFTKDKNIKISNDKICGLYISNWKKDEEMDNGKPKWITEK